MFDLKPVARILFFLLVSLWASVAPATDFDTPGTVAAPSEHSADQQRIQAVIAALDRGEKPPMPVWFSEMPGSFKKVLLRLGRLESMQFLCEQNGERVYELWFAGGRLIWGISDALPHEPANMRVALLEHL